MRYALVRGIPDTFAECLKLELPASPIDLALARTQHRGYVEALRGCVDTLLELPADTRFPDCCFIEDTAVVLGGRALITSPGAASRQGEVDAVHAALEGLGLECLVMCSPATLDGGDVLFTGRELFVGRSSRTNETGIRVLGETFPEWPVTAVPVGAGLHLKSAATRVDEDVLAIAEGAVGDALCAVLATRPGYRVIRVPDGHAANCVRVGESLMHLGGYPATERLLEPVSPRRVALPMSELEKADGGLTCLSLIFEK